MIEKDISNWSIVVLGAWNTRILTPEWISNGRLTENKEIKVEVALNNPDLPIKYRFDNILLQVSDNRIILNPLSDEDTNIKLIEDITVKILTELNHTPLIGIGLNYNYIDKSPVSEQLSLLNIKDNNLYSDSGYEISSTSIKRKFIKNNNVININVIYDNANLKYNFNFHKDITNCVEGIEFIKDKSIEFKNESSNILNNFYNYNQEKEIEHVQ